MTPGVPAPTFLLTVNVFETGIRFVDGGWIFHIAITLHAYGDGNVSRTKMRKNGEGAFAIAIEIDRASTLTSSLACTRNRVRHRNRD